MILTDGVELFYNLKTGVEKFNSEGFSMGDN
jgi:hypothetical protein